jgi:hypothetical protein
MLAPRLRSFLPWLALLSAGGCFVVAPLGEYEDPPATKPAKGGGGGKTPAGGGAGGGSGAAAGMQSTAGEGGIAGEAGNAGSVGKGGSMPTAGQTGCSTNEDCVDADPRGTPARCTDDGKCIALENGVCPLVFDDEGFKADDPIYVGAFAPLPPAVPESSTLLYPLRMALDELSGDLYGGLVMPNGKRRPIVLVACDNAEDSVDAAAKHLFDDVGVSAVLATLLPGDLRRVFEKYAARNVFFLSPVGATSAIASLDDQDLVWTMLGQPKDLVPVYRHLVEDLVEPYLRNVRGIGDRQLKVALLRGADAFGLELSTLVVDELTWNGESVAKNDDDGNFRGYTFDGSISAEDVMKDLLDHFHPDLVISTAGQDVTRANSGLIALLEREWDARAAGELRPFYVLSPFNAGDLGPVTELLSTQLSSSAFYEPGTRFVGVTAAPAEDQTLQNQFEVNLKTKFKNPNVDTGNYYDAFYFLAYALYGARVNRPQGTDIARGMRRLLAGTPFDVGVADIDAVFTELAKDDTSIELDGTLGRPAFDLDTGVHIDSGGVFCIGASESSSLYVESDKLRYVPTTGDFTGKFTCFDGFFPP